MKKLFILFVLFSLPSSLLAQTKINPVHLPIDSPTIQSNTSQSTLYSNNFQTDNLTLLEDSLRGQSNRLHLLIKAVGDVMPGSDFMDNLPPADFEHLKEYFIQGKPDLVIGNLEGAITDYPKCRKKPQKGKIYAFRIPTHYVTDLKSIGFTLFNLANNHAMDFGQPGWNDTKTNLKKQNILAIGDKNKIEYQEIKGKRIACIGISWLSYHNSIYYQPEQTLSLIHLADSTSDIVILSIHGGSEGEKSLEIPDSNEMMLTEPRGNLYRFCHQAIEAGADLILGHGPHVVRGMKLYQNRLIAFSLGNFLTHGSFNTSGNAQNTLILEVELDEQGQFRQGKIIPMKQKTFGRDKGIPFPDTTATTTHLIRKLCSKIPESGLLISDDGSIHPDSTLR